MLKTAQDFSVSLFSDIPDRHYPEQFRLLHPHFLHIKMLFYKSMGYTDESIRRMHDCPHELLYKLKSTLLLSDRTTGFQKFSIVSN